MKLLGATAQSSPKPMSSPHHRNTPGGTVPDQGNGDESTPSVRGDRHDLDKALEQADRTEGAAQRRTPPIEEPEDP